MQKFTSPPKKNNTLDIVNSMEKQRKESPFYHSNIHLFLSQAAKIHPKHTCDIMNKEGGRKKKKSFVLITSPPFLLSQDAKHRVQGKTLNIVNKSKKQNPSTFGRHSESNKQTNQK
jgi:hypothetical protein